MPGVFYVVPTATPSHAEDTPFVRNDRRACLRSIARKRSGSRIRSRTLDPGRVARRRAQDARRRAALADAEPAYRGSKLQQRECTVGPARPRDAFRRSGVVGEGTAAPRQPPIIQTRA